MNTYQELDVIKITKNHPDKNITKGQRGTILLIHSDESCTIEIPNEQGVPIFLGELTPDYFAPYTKNK